MTQAPGRVIGLAAQACVAEGGVVVRPLVAGLRPGATLPVAVSAEARLGGWAHAPAAISTELAAGEAEIHLPLGRSAVRWDEHRPAIYAVTIETPDGAGAGRTVDVRSMAVGTAGEQVTINGRRALLRALLVEAPDMLAPGPDWDALMTRAHRFGMNCVLFPGWSPPPDLRSAAARHGLLTADDLGDLMPELPVARSAADRLAVYGASGAPGFAVASLPDEQSARRWRQSCGHTALVADVHVSDTVAAEVRLANYGPETLREARVRWALRRGRTRVAHGELGPRYAPQGSLTPMGALDVPWDDVGGPGDLQLLLGLAGSTVVACIDVPAAPCP